MSLGRLELSSGRNDERLSVSGTGFHFTDKNSRRTGNAYGWDEGSVRPTIHLRLVAGVIAHQL